MRGLGRALGRGTDWIYFVLEPLAASRDDETRANVVKEANSLAARGGGNSVSQSVSHYHTPTNGAHGPYTL